MITILRMELLKWITKPLCYYNRIIHTLLKQNNRKGEKKRKEKKNVVATRAKKNIEYIYLETKKSIIFLPIQNKIRNFTIDKFTRISFHRMLNINVVIRFI